VSSETIQSALISPAIFILFSFTASYHSNLALSICLFIMSGFLLELTLIILIFLGLITTLLTIHLVHLSFHNLFAIALASFFKEVKYIHQLLQPTPLTHLSINVSNSVAVQ